MRLDHSLIFAALFATAGSAVAEPQSPPPPPSGPVAVPYPDPEPLPPECHNRFCLPKPGAAQSGSAVAAKKHIGQVKYSDYAKSGEAVSADMATATIELTESPGAPVQTVQVVGMSWGKIAGAGPVYSADPMEGGQIARDSGAPATGAMEATPSAAAVAERKLRSGRPTYGNLVDDTPVMVSEPLAKGTATFKTLAGLCATGKHLDKVKIAVRAGSYTLHDATVVSVTPADPIDGQPMEVVTLSYASIGD